LNLNPFITIASKAQAAPEATLVASTKMKMSAEEFVDVAARMATLIRESCKEGPAVVALDLEPELFAIAAFACFHQGLTVTSYRQDHEALRQAGCTLVVTQRQELVDRSIPRLVLNQAAMEALATITPIAPSESIDAGDVASIFFSSGTTGVAKLIPVSYGQLFTREAFVRKSRIRGRYMSLLGNGTFGGFITMFSQILNLEAFLAPGLPTENLRVIKNWQVNHVFGSPAQLEALANVAEERSESLDLNEIQSTGNSLPPILATRLSKLTRGVITNIYASTEAGLVAMKQGEWGEDSYCGDIIDGVELEVVDQHDKPVAAGAVGELRVKAPGQASQYLGNPEISKQHFKDGWFYPGDLALLRGKSLFLMGRKLEIINAGGVKVNPIALDHLAREYPGVEDAAVFSFESSGGIMEIGLAFVSSTPPDPKLLKVFIARKFGDGAPQHYYRVPAIPRNELGKALRNSLAEAYKSRISQ
jgi:long-chain acyl-CoA synthetase